MATIIEQGERGTSEPAETAVTEDVLEPKLGTSGFEKIPHCIYLFYIAEPKTGSKFNKILHYYDGGDSSPIDTPAKLEARLGALIENARETSAGNQYPPPNGEDWRHVVLDRIGYVAFAFDFEMKREPTFRVKYNQDHHHSFYDGRVLEIAGCKVAVCVNHLKKAVGGIPLGRETQPFLFELDTEPKIEWEGMVGHPDSGGTNQGPGVAPPE